MASINNEAGALAASFAEAYEAAAPDILQKNSAYAHTLRRIYLPDYNDSRPMILAEPD